MRLVPALAALILVPWLMAADGVPVASVVLYSSGVGYYEHAGVIDGTTDQELRFKTAQINDVLKSLVVQDLDGGRVGTVSYRGQAPLERTLKSFQVDVTGNPSLAQLLGQLRGAQVSLTVNTESISGVILGCEVRQKPGTDKAPIQVPVLTVVTAAGLRQVELDQVQVLKLDDAHLQQELNRALAAIAGARDQDAKPVLIHFAGEGQRRVRIGYVVEAPVWKTSYRLVMPIEGDAAAKGQIQGWAIVENQTEADWNEVDLRLVSGQPISFIQDLYRPLFAQRPVVEAELAPGVRPVAYESGKKDAPKPDLDGRMKERKAARVAAPAPASIATFGAAENDMVEGVAGREEPLDPTASIQSAASAEKVGELFQYQVPKVSLPRQRNAMLPIVTDAIAIQRVSIYNVETNPRHPLNGAWLDNTTGKHLQGGPITVFDGGAYGGDARLDSLAPGAKRLISYALDIPVTVDATTGSEERQVVSGKLLKGVLYLQAKLTAKRTYAIDNGAQVARNLVIEHRFRSGWSAIDTPEPSEKTPTHWRFTVPVGPAAQASLSVTETIVTGESMGLVNLDVDSLLVYAKTGSLAPKVRDLLTRAASLKGAVIDADRQIQASSERLEAIAQDQNRIRENMRQVNQNSQYYQRLLAKLNEQESKVEALQTATEGFRAARVQAQAALEEFLSAADAQ